MECSICFEAITKATGSTTLSCEHNFHFRCIDEWFTKQLCEGLHQTCPCCRSEGAELDRCMYEEVKEEEEDDDDETFEDEESETASEGEEDEDEEEELSFRDVMRGHARWQRVGEGQYMIILPHGMEAIAYESVRCLFGPLNVLEVEQETSEEIAARKIQAIFRGYHNRKTYQGVRSLLRLNPESYLMM